MLSLFNIILIACVSSASLFAAGSSGYHTAEDVAEIMKRHSDRVSGFLEGDAVAVLDCHTLVPAYTAGHMAVIQAFSEESEQEDGFCSFGSRGTIALERGPQAVLLKSYPNFLIYGDGEARAYVSFTWSWEENSYELMLYVPATHRGKGMESIAVSLGCSYLDKLRTIEGLEDLRLVAEYATDNVVVLGVMAKSPLVPFDLKNGFVYFSYPSSKRVITEETLAIINGLSSDSHKERGKAQYNLLEQQKLELLAKAPKGLHRHLLIIFAHLMSACQDEDDFSDAKLKAAYSEMALPADDSKLTPLQLSIQAIKSSSSSDE